MSNSRPANSLSAQEQQTTLFRINHFLSKVGLCSRRGADRLVRQGRVQVNGQVAALGQKVCAQDQICVDGERVDGDLLGLQYLPRSQTLQGPVTSWYFYRLYYKPRGIVSTQNSAVENNFVSALSQDHSAQMATEWPAHFFAVGRLDKASEGALLLTNHGDLCNFLLQQDTVPKRYLVTVTPKITQDFLQQMACGVAILGQVTQPCEVFRLADNVMQIELKQGLNRQIRRMCQALGYRVERLIRVGFAGVALDGLMAGQTRMLSESEVQQLEARLRLFQLGSTQDKSI